MANRSVHKHSIDLRLIFTAAAGVFAALIILLTSSLLGGREFHSVSGTYVPPALVLQIGQMPWHSENGFLTGFITFDPVSGRAASLLSPSTSENLLGGFLSPNGDLFYGLTTAGKSRMLTRVSLSTQGASDVIARGDADTVFFGYVAAAPDGRHLAFQKSVTTRPKTKNDSPTTVRTAYLQLEDGIPHAIGDVAPLAFSPESDALFAATSSAYLLIPLAEDIDHARTVSGLVPSELTMVRFSGDGKCLFTRDMSVLGPAEVYAFDWKNASATHLATVPLVEDVAYGFAGDVFMTASNGTLDSRRCTSNGLVSLPATHTKPFPPRAQILGVLP